MGKEEEMNRKEILFLILALAIALAVRIYFIPAPAYEQDFKNLKTWSQATVEHGVHNIYDKTDCDYPPAYLYVCKAVGYSYRIFYPKYDEHTYLFDFLVKMPAILADIIASFIIFWFVRKKNTYAVSFAVMAAYAFNPAIILNSTWGTVDSVLLALAAVLALINDKHGWAWGLITVGILTKIQLIVLVPIIIFVTWKRKGFKTLINSIAVAWCTLIVILLPFFCFHQIDKVIDCIFNAVGEYPYLSLYAFNFWWLISGGQGRWASDARLLFDGVTLRMIGTILYGIFYLLLIKYLFNKEKDEDAIFLGSFLAIFSFFMLPTEMHERYIIPALIFLLLAAVKDRKLMLTYVVLSFTTFLSLLFVLFWTYPKNYPQFSHLWQPSQVGMILSLINVALYLFVLYRIVKDIKLKYIGSFFAAIIILFGGLHFLKPIQPVYLGDIQSKAFYQQWGKLRIDRSVNGSPLTVNGFKYSKGIGTHAYSSIEYILGGRYSILDGAVGLDDEAASGNKIQAWIYADNNLIYNSGIMTSWIDPHYFRLNIKGVKDIRLVITDGGDGINCDHSDWLGIKALP